MIMTGPPNGTLTMLIEYDTGLKFGINEIKLYGEKILTIRGC
jgi:hypothetical protein